MLRPYQKKASDAAVKCLKDGLFNGLLVLPTASGKAHIIADIASRIDAPLLVFAPTREITMQNYEKICNVGMNDVGIYSASLGEKNIRKITLATIGSVHNQMDDFRLFKYVLVDEAHRVCAEDGMYKDYLTGREDRCIVGLTATPFRSVSFMGIGKLTFLTRTNPRIFDRVLHVTQVSEMMEGDYLARPEYFDMTDRIDFDVRRVKLNTTGLDFDEESLREEYNRSSFAKQLLACTKMVLCPKDGSKRKGVIVFTRFVKEAEVLTNGLNAMGVSAKTISSKTPTDERKAAVEAFKRGEIQVFANAAVFLEGFDYPALDTVIIASPTRSLTRYMQMVGRCVRPFEGKTSWIVDLSGNYKLYGKIEDIKIVNPAGGNQWIATTHGRELTGIIN